MSNVRLLINAALMILLINLFNTVVADAPLTFKQPEASRTELERKVESLRLLYSGLIEADDKQQILIGLKELKDYANHLQIFLAAHNGYQPDLFFITESIDFFLQSIFDADGKIKNCYEIHQYMEYSFRTPITELEEPIPSLWVVVEQVCSNQPKSK